jgi:hypothetical protein
MLANLECKNGWAGTQGNVWQASATGSSDPSPRPTPLPSVKAVENGYDFEWRVSHPGGSSASSSAIHNQYLRKTEAGKAVLVCIDMAVRGGALEDEMCEGGILPRVK